MSGVEGGEGQKEEEGSVTAKAKVTALVRTRFLGTSE